MKALVIIPCIWAAAALLWFFTVGAELANSQAQLPEQSALMTACHTATQLGQVGGVNVSRCRKVAVVEEGNFALVTVKVWVDGQGKFLVSVALQKSVWTQSAINVAPTG